MWIKEPGAVTERIEFLGRKELCSSLLKEILRRRASFANGIE